MQNLINSLKNNNEDYEFYPTTKEMINKIVPFIKKSSILDIGCGTCNFLKYIKELNKENNKYLDCRYYIIEKSSILLQQLPSEAILVGTDFNDTTLIDKKCDYIFCNPPYSEFENWTMKILNEAYCESIFLIIPTRWKENKDIQETIRKRNFTYSILDTTDFLNAERKARCNVDIIKFDFIKEYNKDPFNSWFDNNFKTKEEKEDGVNQEEIINKNELLQGESYIEKLLNLYNNEMFKLQNNFLSITSLDYKLLKELNINKNTLSEALKTKIKNLKSKYWKELFKNLEVLNKKFTNKTRGIFLNRLNDNLSVDFNLQNIQEIILWALKNCNMYVEKQTIELFDDLTYLANIINYKSNQKVFGKEEYRYTKKEFCNYTLDYRIILESMRGHYCSPRYCEMINDIKAIAYNFGFETVELCFEKQGYNEFKQDFGTCYLKNNSIFLEYKFYKNGNLHLKINKDFMRMFNVYVSKNKGWIKNKKQCEEEFGYSDGFDLNIKIEKNILMLN